MMWNNGDIDPHHLCGAEDNITHILQTGFPDLPYTLQCYGRVMTSGEITLLLEKGKGDYWTFLFAKEAQTIVQEHDKVSPIFFYLAFQALHSR